MRSFARLVLIPAAVLAPAFATAQSDDTAKIIAAARDYIDGFAAADTTRMRRALHPDLAKRLVTGKAGSPENQDAQALVTMTGSRAARATTAIAPADSIKIFDQYRDIAMVRIGAPGWVDYLHVGRFGDEWRIINVAWALRR